jgi:hypothetical protein
MLRSFAIERAGDCSISRRGAVGNSHFARFEPDQWVSSGPRDISDVIGQQQPREAIEVDGKWNPALCYIWRAMVEELQPSSGPRLKHCWIPWRLVAQRI